MCCTQGLSGLFFWTIDHASKRRPSTITLSLSRRGHAFLPRLEPVPPNSSPPFTRVPHVRVDIGVPSPLVTAAYGRNHREEVGKTTVCMRNARNEEQHPTTAKHATIKETSNAKHQTIKSKSTKRHEYRSAATHEDRGRAPGQGRWRADAPTEVPRGGGCCSRTPKHPRLPPRLGRTKRAWLVERGEDHVAKGRAGGQGKCTEWTGRQGREADG